MIERLRKVCPDFELWGGVVVASAGFFGLTFGTQLHPLAIGLLLSSVTLLVAMIIFELAWQTMIRVAKMLGLDVETSRL